MAPLGFEPRSSPLIGMGKEERLRNVTQTPALFPRMRGRNVTEGWRKMDPAEGVSASGWDRRAGADPGSAAEPNKQNKQKNLTNQKKKLL